MQTENHLRRAAILVASLDSDAADTLLEKLSPADADRLRRMVAALDEIDLREQEAVIEQFLGLESQEPPPPSTALAREGPPFHFLHEARSDQLLPFLEGEHPQTVAVVVSHLPPEQAARLLYALAPALQADVMRRLVDLEEADPAVVREVERGLEERIARHVRTQRRRTAGLSALVSILESADRRLQGRLHANLSRHAPQLARLLPRQAAIHSFDELWRLDDKSLVRLLDAADPQTTILALAGAPGSLVERLLSQLPEHEADSLREAWRQLGPTPLSDIEQAQEEMVHVAGQLELAPGEAPLFA
jgi:flagellar motor switch protein FliG